MIEMDHFFLDVTFISLLASVFRPKFKIIFILSLIFVVFEIIKHLILKSVFPNKKLKLQWKDLINRQIKKGLQKIMSYEHTNNYSGSLNSRGVSLNSKILD